MALLETWRNMAYDQNQDQQRLQMFWANYFNYEKGIYEEILKTPNAPVKGTVKELAEKFNVDLMIMVGFLDGINDSLKNANPIETMEEDTEVNLDYDMELLYKNMVDAKYGRGTRNSSAVYVARYECPQPFCGIPRRPSSSQRGLW